MLKQGNFYISIDNDALIISNIFNYKIKESNKIIKVGFPVNSINKIIMKLETLKLNYLIADSVITNKSDIKNSSYDEYLNNVINKKIYINRINEI